MAKTSAQKHIEKAVEHLEAAAGIFESQAMTEQSEVLDGAMTDIKEMVTELVEDYRVLTSVTL